MSIDNKYVLAMYDVRGKQDYIFRGKKLKEIVGGSLVIRDIFRDELFPAAIEYARSIGNISEQPSDKERQTIIYNYKDVEDDTFSREDFIRHLEEGYLGEVVYDGGGNFFILYKDMEVFRGINKIFTKRVLEHTFSLTVLCSAIEGVDFDNYTNVDKNEDERIKNRGDREKLYAVNRAKEARFNSQIPAQVLPFTQVDYANSLPLYVEYNTEAENYRKISRESYRKYEKYNEIKDIPNSEYNEKVLDNIIRKKGEDSWIAVMYIDGNNMGDKVKSSLETDSDATMISYEEAVKKLRDFSKEIQKNYIEDRIKSIDKALEEKYMFDEKNEYGNNMYKRRLVVYAGDEINVILNAHDVYTAVKAYFEGMPEGNSACAGVSLFKSHTPYSDAYRIAEQCCESGKKLMKKNQMGDVNLVDFHYCQGAIGTEISEIRNRTVGDIISKPWFVSASDKGIGEYPKSEVVTLKMIDNIVGNLNQFARTNVKGILDAALSSEAELYSELLRMFVRKRSDSPNGQNLFDITDSVGYDGEPISREKLRKIIYDIVTVYDLWFRDEKGEKEYAENR